jgi:hypothetical protein
MNALGQPPIKLLYTDKCCSDRPFAEDVIESLKYDLQEIPLLELEENEYVLATNKQNAAILAESALREALDDLKRNPNGAAVGLDTEWDVYYDSNVPRSKIRMIQVATSGTYTNVLNYFYHLLTCIYSEKSFRESVSFLGIQDEVCQENRFSTSAGQSSLQ